MKKQIITNRNVDKTFDKEPCRLLREIVGFNGNELGVTKYIVQTKQVTFVDYEVPTYDETGYPLLDENGENITETKQALKVLAVKQSDGILLVTKEVSDNLYKAIKSQLELGDSLFDYQQQVELMALLIETQMIEPYDTEAKDWEIYNG